MKDILLIEDNPKNAYLVTFILQNQGHKVRLAATGAEGLTAAAAQAPALILLDIQLPDVDGFTVAARLREIESLRHVPIVAVTSYAMKGDYERIMDAGCTAYIEKPIDPDTFANQLSEYLN